MPDSAHPYDHLTPDVVLSSVENLGFETDARIVPLNSYENRVYQVGLTDAPPIIVKFYRPERWTDEQILEEHAFTCELQALEIPVIEPIQIESQTLFHYQGFSMALYRRRSGRAPDLEDFDSLMQLGRYLGRIHACGALKTFQARPTLNIERWLDTSCHYILSTDFIPDDLRASYTTVTQNIKQTIAENFSRVSWPAIRVHGDCHAGNILMSGEIPYFVDFDDSMNGPAIQDLWLFLSGDRSDQIQQMNELLEGYQEFFDFDYNQLPLIEALRSARVISYAAWLARRWTDPAFVKHFPWFGSGRFWPEHILELREQEAALQEPALSLLPR